MTAATTEPPPADKASRRDRKAVDRAAAAGTAPEPPKLRRRPLLVALSVLLTAIGALLGAFLLTTLSGTDAYVGVRTDIERGSRITANDLVRVQMSDDPNLNPVPWDQQSVLIDMYATQDMAKGTVVTRDAVANEIAPVGGNSIVGLALTPGQGVSGDLRVGQRVTAVVVPASAELTGKPTEYLGTVASIKLSDDGQTKLVDVQVASADAAPLSAAAARQEVSLFVRSQESANGDTQVSPSESTDGSSASPSSSS